MKLTPEEKELIKTNEQLVDNVMAIINVVNKFKEGDFLVAFHHATGFGDTRVRPVVNSYGAAKKFQVVAVDKHGISYMKELNKKWKPSGRLISSVRHNTARGTLHYNLELTYNFAVDPDYADAIILDDQANYDASNILKEKSDIFKDIAKYNKSIKIKTETKELATFLTTVKVGDILWRSNMSSWSVTQIGIIPRSSASRIAYSTPFMKVITTKGKEEELCFNDICNKALYTARPRTYKELKDPK